MTVFVHPGIEYLRLRVCICKGIHGEEHSVLSTFFCCFICLPKPSPLQNSRGWSTIQGSLLPQDSPKHTHKTQHVEGLVAHHLHVGLVFLQASPLPVSGRRAPGRKVVKAL